MFIQKHAIFHRIDAESFSLKLSWTVQERREFSQNKQTQTRAERTADRFQLRRALRALCVDRRRFHIYSTLGAQALDVVDVYESTKSWCKDEFDLNVIQINSK